MNGNYREIDVCEFSIYHKSGLISDGLRGGLIIAKSHDENGAKIIKFDDGKFYDHGEIEGWEYLINPLAADKYAARLKIINDEFLDCNDLFESFEIPNDSNIIDLMPVTLEERHINRYLFLIEKYSFFIVNKYSTKKYINELIVINSYNDGIEDMDIFSLLAS